MVLASGCSSVAGHGGGGGGGGGAPGADRGNRGIGGKSPVGEVGQQLGVSSTSVIYIFKSNPKLCTKLVAFIKLNMFICWLHSIIHSFKLLLRLKSCSFTFVHTINLDNFTLSYFILKFSCLSKPPVLDKASLLVHLRQHSLTRV